MDKLKFNISFEFDKKEILKLIFLYVYTDRGGQYTKKGFVSKIKNEIKYFGIDDYSLYGENFDDYWTGEINEGREIMETSLRLYKKWYGGQFEQ